MDIDTNDPDSSSGLVNAEINEINDQHSSSGSVNDALKSPINNLLALSDTVANELSTPIKNVTKMDTFQEISPGNSEVSIHDEDMEITNEIVEKEINVNIDLNNQFGDSKVKDNLNEIFDIFKELSNKIRVSTNGYELLLNQVLFRFINENSKEHDSIVKLIGHFRKYIHEASSAYAIGLYKSIDNSNVDANENKYQKTTIRNQRSTKLRGFDRLILYYFILIINKYENYETLIKIVNTKAKVKKSFKQNFDNNYDDIKCLIKVNDLKVALE